MRAIWRSSALSRMDDPALVYRTPVGHLSVTAQMLSQLVRRMVKARRLR